MRGALRRPLRDPLWKHQAGQIRLAPISAAPPSSCVLLARLPLSKRSGEEIWHLAPPPCPQLDLCLTINVSQKGLEGPFCLAARQPNIVVICPSMVGTGVALGSAFLLLIGSGTLEAVGWCWQSRDLSILGTLCGF